MKKIFPVLAVPSLALGAATTAHGAEDQSVEKAELIGEVIVSARRRSETLQDVPQTVNVVTEKALQDYVIIDFEDISQLVPGLTLEGGTTGYQSSASVRGVRFQIESQASGPTTQFYVNEAPVEANSVFQAQYDLGQIEVLKGPQGATRGLSAPSGAFTLTTQPADPAGGWNGSVATTFDDHDGMNVQAALNVPIVEDLLAVRLAGQLDESDANGIESINGKGDPFAGHGQLPCQPDVHAGGFVPRPPHVSTARQKAGNVRPALYRAGREPRQPQPTTADVGAGTVAARQPLHERPALGNCDRQPRLLRLRDRC